MLNVSLGQPKQIIETWRKYS